MNDEQPPRRDAWGRWRASPPVNRFASREAAVLACGAASFVLLITSLYFSWDDGTGPLVGDVANLWFNCIHLAVLAVTLFCVWRPRLRTAGAVALAGLTIGMFYSFAESAFGMFTYDDAQPGAGFWLGLASYIALVLGAVGAGILVADECGGGCRPDGRPRSPGLVLGLAVVSSGWIVARFLPDFVIRVLHVPTNESGSALSETLEPAIHHRGMVARLEGAQFIPELAGWTIFALAAPLGAWVLRRQLAAAFLSGFVVYFVARIASAVAIDYSFDYTQDLNNGVRRTVDYGLDSGFLALLATTTVAAFVIAWVYFTGPDAAPDAGPDQPAAPAPSHRARDASG